MSAVRLAGLRTAQVKPAGLILCTLAALAEGFDSQSMGVAAPRLIGEFGLTPSQFGLVFSAATAGLSVGAFLGGRAADHWGRSRALGVSLLVFGVFSLLTAFTPGFTALLYIRFLTGLGLGGAMPNFITLAAESVSTKRRVTAVALITAAIPLGGAVSGVVALSLGVAGNWRYIFYVGGAVPIVAALMAFIMVRDPPPQHSDGSVQTEAMPFRQALFGSRSRITALLWMAFFLTHLVLFSLLNWLPSLSVGLGLAREESGWAAILFNVGGALGGALVSVLDGINRRLMVLLMYTGMLVALAALALLGSHGLVLFIAAIFFAGLFTIGGQIILYGLAALSYPAAARGTGVGIALALGRLGAVFGPALIGVSLAGGLSSGGVLLLVLPFALGGGLLTRALAER